VVWLLDPPSDEVVEVVDEPPPQPPLAAAAAASKAAAAPRDRMPSALMRVSFGGKSDAVAGEARPRQQALPTAACTGYRRRIVREEAPRLLWA
jgi:hypothetical protein